MQIEYPFRPKYDWLRETLGGIRTTDPKQRRYEPKPNETNSTPPTLEPTHRPGSSKDVIKRIGVFDVPVGADVLPTPQDEPEKLVEKQADEEDQQTTEE